MRIALNNTISLLNKIILKSQNLKPSPSLLNTNNHNREIKLIKDIQMFVNNVVTYVQSLTTLLNNINSQIPIVNNMIPSTMNAHSAQTIIFNETKLLPVVCNQNNPDNIFLQSYNINKEAYIVALIDIEVQRGLIDGNGNYTANIPVHL